MFYIFGLCSLIASVVCQSGFPVFKPTFEEVILFAKESAQVNCSALGEKPIQYTWYNSMGDVIPSDPSERVHARNSSDGSVLVFRSLDKYDEGSYSCSAENSHGSSTKVYVISVNESSDYQDVNETVEIRNIHVVNITERSVEFLVNTSGNSAKVVVYYKVKEGRKDFEKKVFVGENILVENLTPGREYTFLFQLYGDTFSNGTSLDVTLLPDRPEVIFRSLTPSTLEIEWFKPIDDILNSAVDEYLLTYGSVTMKGGGNEWEQTGCVIEIKIKNNKCGSRYTIAGLNSGSYYEIQLVAHTATGYGQPYINKIRVP